MRWQPESIDSLIVAGNATRLAESASRILGCAIEQPDVFLKACRKARSTVVNLPLGKPDRHGNTWSNQSWFSWLKNRLLEVQYPEIGHGVPNDILTCEMHMGFCFIEENPLHLFNLRKKKDEDSKKTRDVARSKICKYDKVIKPINIVAIRVFGWNEPTP